MSQVPVAQGPSASPSNAGTAETDSSGFVPLTRYSEVKSDEHMVRFLRTKLADKVNRVKELENQLKAAYSKEQLADDREEFILNELAAQVSDLDCKSATYSGCFFDSC